MGSCIGRCICEVGKCFCCDCMIFGTNLKDTISRRKHIRTTKTSQSFSLRRQSSSTTLEFENLMFEFNLPESSASMIQMQPTSVSSWLTLKDDSKHYKEFKVQNVCYADRKRANLANLAMSFNALNSSVNLIDPNDRSSELPIIDSLVCRSVQMRNKCESPTDMHKDRTSLDESSSQGELQSLQWENDLIVDEFNAIGDQNGDTELEWDHFDAHNYAIDCQSEQLIHQNEDLSKFSFNQMPN